MPDLATMPEVDGDSRASARSRVLMTQAAYARHRGVTRQSVNQAVREGRIRLTRGGLVNMALADATWSGSTNPTRGGDRRPEMRTRALRRAAEANGAARGPEVKPPVARPSAPDSDTRSLISAKVDREGWQAKLAELDYKRRSGELLEAGDVEKAVFEVNRAVRDRLMGIPARVSAILAAVDTPAEIEQLLAKEIREALDELSRLESRWKSGPA
jgi:hypothetical protein